MKRNKKYQHELFQGLENLLTLSEAFYATTVEMDSQIYKLYDYRLATWEDYHLPFGLEARGVMFNITNLEDPILVSATPKKFFNYEQGENLEHDKYGFGLRMEKLDGSLISTYIHKGKLLLKSKMSLMSEQSNMANKFLAKPENAKYKEELKRLVEMGYTVNLELISPDNQIVVPYDKTDLIILNLRSMNDGSMIYARQLTNLLEKDGDFKECLKHMCSFIDLTGIVGKDHADYLDVLRQEVGLEGYVIEILAPEPYLVKVKNLDYIKKHYLKDGIENDRRLFESIIDEQTDDLRSIFVKDPISMKRLTDMENKVMPLFNSLIAKVDNFYEENKALDRKEYAIKANTDKELKKYFLTSFAIGKYLGRELRYKEYAKKYRREIWGIKGNGVVEDESLVPAKPRKVKL